MVEGLPQLLELGRFGNHNQMLFEDMIVIDEEGDDDDDENGDDEQYQLQNHGTDDEKTPCDSDPDIHLLAPISRQLL